MSGHPASLQPVTGRPEPEGPSLVIDAHQHFWNPQLVSYPWLGPDLAPINRPFEFADLAPILAAEGIDRTILVQSADSDDDTQYMLAIAGEHPEIAGVVAWVPTDRPDELPTRLRYLQDQPRVVGIRNLIHNMTDPDWLVSPQVDRGFDLLAQAGLTYDVVAVLPRHLENVATVAARHPDLKLVIDHLAKPPVQRDDWEPWKTLIARAASFPNVYAKVSGLYPAGDEQRDWTAADIRPFVHYALELFGPERLMFGSDWPVSILFGGYAAVWEALQSVFDELTPTERASILGLTAADFYAIPVARLTEAHR